MVLNDMFGLSSFPNSGLKKERSHLQFQKIGSNDVVEFL